MNRKDVESMKIKQWAQKLKYGAMHAFSLFCLVTLNLLHMKYYATIYEYFSAYCSRKNLGQCFARGFQQKRRLYMPLQQICDHAETYKDTNFNILVYFSVSEN